MSWNATFIDRLGTRVALLLAAFAQRLAAQVPSLTVGVQQTANAAFPLRAVATFIRSPIGAELAVVIDVHSERCSLALTADLGLDDGTILADGPSLTLPADSTAAVAESTLTAFLTELETFLRRVEPTAMQAASRLQ